MRSDAKPTREIEAMTDRAMALDESIECGPGHWRCEDDRRCPAHGREFEDETDAMRTAREHYDRRYATEVNGAGVRLKHKGQKTQ